VQLAVIRITDEPILTWSESLRVPTGEIGELLVWGDNVSPSYWRRPVANSLAKIHTTQGEIRHRMGDLGYLDNKGRVWFCGRKSQRVITQQGTLYTIPCESVFNQHPKVRRTALIGVGCPPMQRPVLCVELLTKAKPPETESLREELRALGSRYPVTDSIKEILFHPVFPVDVRHNAKIFREKLAAWAEGQLR
jgi:acyl-CoA synthetase (AMP-forming)/AMP-acid ligase II